MAENSGFRLFRYEGLGEQYFWLWYVKPTEEGGSPLERESEIELLPAPGRVVARRARD